MQGHGYGQPVKQPPHTAWLVFLRVLFVALGFLTIGFMAWAMMLRLAVVTRRSRDWGLFVAVLAADILSITLVAVEPGDEIHTTGGWLGLLLLLCTLVGTIAYYLAADTRHYLLQQQAYRAQHPAPAYGYPAPVNPYGATTVPIPPATHGTPTVPPTPPVTPHTPPPMTHTTGPQPPLTTPPPQRPAPARIDQVRAELDELSDYLRRQDGHEGGR
ncbi:hypothetical protein JK361_21900 [Streptomyces sp. 5-8]|uniref:Integral membrane protein n=1 Tax=Streptomyces musisoli TaxID=2802280 RepID=A0ABS1P4C8_9ACTN|nr:MULTISPECIES: hypothetical protein [Streptomyces]MBL1107226.1 hypothetical protein [Streptomyces musisoli]MBY8844566.1 hypothetical protein [Streptomyces sp. SP2-10]